MSAAPRRSAVQRAAVVRRIAWLVVGLGIAAGAGCQRSEGGGQPPPAVAEAAVPPAYAKDIAAVCDAVQRSGADRVPPGERALPIATWLAANLATPESHAFLVRIQPLVGEPKATALEAEARRVGLAGCALAAEWR